MTNPCVPSLINGRYPIMLTPDRHEFHHAPGRHLWESKRLESCATLIKPGMTVYDLGAESGDFTCLYRQWVGETGTVVAVEPQPQYFPSIRTTFEANDFGPPLWFSGFVSDVTDLAPAGDNMAAERLDDGSGWPASSTGTVVPDFGFRHLCQQADSTPQITLDDLCDLTGTVPDAVVMDIEGAEWRALSGATRMLAEARPLMWVSLHPQPLAEWYGKDIVDVHILMRDAGYRGTFLGLCTEQLWLYEPLS